MKFCNPIGVRRKSSWTTHLSPSLPPSLSSQELTKFTDKQLSLIAWYMMCTRLLWGAKKGVFKVPLLRERPYTKAVEQTLTLDYTASTFEGKKQFSLTVSQHQPKTCSTGQAPHTVYLHRVKATLCRKGVSAHKRWGPYRKGHWPKAQQNPSQFFLLPAPRTAELTMYQCLWFPMRPLGILPPQWSRAPLETHLSRSPHTARRTCLCTHALAHTPMHTPPLFPHSISLEGKWEGSLGVQMEGAATPSQGNNHSLFCYSHCNTKTYARRMTHSLANSPSKLLFHDCLTVFQPFQAY